MMLPAGPAGQVTGFPRLDSPACPDWRKCDDDSTEGNGEMKVPLLDLKVQFATIEAAVRREIDEVLASQHFILGPKVEALEARTAEYTGTRHAIGVSSGTDALLIALMALDVGPGDEVVTTPYTFFATAGCIARVGARPVFVDIDGATMNLDLDQVSRALTARTKAVMPVHLFGRCVDMRALRALTDPRGIPIIEDAAQALGAESHGARAGGLGAIGCFSFFPTKNLGAAGDAGIVTTNDDRLVARLRLLRGHGASPKYFHSLVGGNFRLDAIQAAILLAKFPHLDVWTARRNENAALYQGLFAAAGLAAPGGPLLLPPVSGPGERNVWNQFVIRAPNRDRLAAHLNANGVQTEVYYPRPMHRQECFAYLGHKAGDFPVAEACAADSLALPVEPAVSADAIRYVVDRVGDFLGAST
jgi:dTDP-4-amino-4,6-dideoxygalactose transaminase